MTLPCIAGQAVCAVLSSMHRSCIYSCRRHVFGAEVARVCASEAIRGPAGAFRRRCVWEWNGDSCGTLISPTAIGLLPADHTWRRHEGLGLRPAGVAGPQDVFAVPSWLWCCTTLESVRSRRSIYFQEYPSCLCVEACASIC
eukprot:jgi/Ulvmu1/9546/UM053_0035.1